MHLRAAVMIVALASSVAHADDHVTSYVAIGLGPTMQTTGAVGDRISQASGSSTYLTSRLFLGGSVGRIGIELFVQGCRLSDHLATDSRDRARTIVAGGAGVRYAIVDHRYFVFAARAGLLVGTAGGDAMTTGGACDPGAPCPTTTYEPPGYRVLGLSTGVRAQLQARPENGLIAGFVDVDLSPVYVGFPDDARFGALRSIVFGLSFGAAR